MLRIDREHFQPIAEFNAGQARSILEYSHRLKKSFFHKVSSLREPPPALSTNLMSLRNRVQTTRECRGALFTSISLPV